MPVTVVHNVGSIKLGSESYRLVRTDDHRAFSQTFLDEPPWSEGVPAMISDPQQTWHMGGLKSQQGIPGTSEYGKNTDTRFPFRLLPGPRVVDVALAGSGVTPTHIFDALGAIFVLAGRFVYTIAPSDDSVVQIKDFGAGVNAIDGIKWEDDLVLITTDEVANSLWKVTTSGFQTDTFQGAGDTAPAFPTGSIEFTQTSDVAIYRLAAGINRLFGINKTGEVRNVLSGDDPMVDANWRDSVQAGEKDPPPNGLVAYQKTTFAGKAEGLFGVDTDGFGVSLIKRVTKEACNGIGTEVYDPFVMFPHGRGLIRFVPGLVESVGLEQEVMNESPVKGPFKALAPDQQWLYGALAAVDGDTYILWARERRSLGPLTWDTWVHWVAEACEAMHVSALNSPPRVWLGKGVNAAYVKLSTGAGAPDPSSGGYEFALSGTRFSVKYRFGDWHDKDLPKIDIVGKNLTAARYWEVSYAVDGGSFSNLDIDGSVMRLTSNGLTTFFLPTSIVGREVQFKYDLVSDDVTEAPELNFVEPFAVPRGRHIPMYSVQLHLATGIRLDDEVEARSSLTQFNDLETLLGQPAAVASFGPWGDNKNVWVRGLRLIEVLQTGSQEPEFLVEALIQRREEA